MEITSDAYRANGLLQFFSFEGRVRRMTFWINTLICGVASFILSQMFVDVRFNEFTWELGYHISNPPIYYIATLLIILRVLSITVRRWHDLDQEGVWAVASFYPILAVLFPSFVFLSGVGNVITILGSIALYIASGFLGFVPGDDDQNSFGPPPDEGQWF